MSKVKAVKNDEQLENSLIESKQLFKIVFEHSPVAITVTDTKGCIVAWNPLVEKLLGMGKADLFNKHISFLYPPQEWKRVRSLNPRQRGILPNVMTKVLRKDGSLLNIIVSVSDLKDSKGKVIGSIGIFNDVTHESLWGGNTTERI